MGFHNDRLQETCRKESRLAAVQEMSLLSSHEKTSLLGVHSGQTQKPTSQPVVSALKIRKRALLEIQWQNKVRGDKVRGKQAAIFPQILNV